MTSIGSNSPPVSPDTWEDPEMRGALAGRDISTVYKLLRKGGVSQRRIAAFTGQSQSDVSAILKGRQVTAYDVLVRIADGLGFPRGYMGLAYDEVSAARLGMPMDVFEGPRSESDGSSERLAEVLSDLESSQDRLGIAEDVYTVAAVVAALSTTPPLSVALLGDWGIGKSSFMRQVRDRVDELARLSRSSSSAFASNVCQVSFNAWHYSDDHLWVGLIDHLFAELARPATELTGSASDLEIKALKAKLSSRRAERDHLDYELKAVEQIAGRPRWLMKLLAPFHIFRLTRAMLDGVWPEFKSGGWRILLMLVAVIASATVAVLDVGYFRWLGAGAAALAVLAPTVTAWRRLSGLTEQAREELLARKTDVNTDIQKVEKELNKLDPVRRLDKLLNDISAAETYENYRGLTGKIHRHLRRLSVDIATVRAKWERESVDGTPPLQRIVLYIDDLDRCSPRRVVEVLSAVNLLLTMDLFVVVVAIDPQWLLRSLERHYEGLFDDSAVTYLDKIFHVSMALRPMGERAVNYLQSLLMVESDAITVTAEDSVQFHAVEELADVAKPATMNLTPSGLRLRAAEREFLARLLPLLSTPRAVKKLVNLYRLLRLGIPDRELPEFIGGTQGGPFQVAALLLALLVGSPHEARRRFEVMANLRPGEDIEEVLDDQPLQELIRNIRKEIPLHGEVDTYRRWSRRVARFGFTTYDLFSH